MAPRWRAAWWPEFGNLFRSPLLLAAEALNETGGQIAFRGLLVQTLVAVLDAVETAEPWDRVTLEPNGASEKVDILWEYPHRTRAVQVKSTAGAFTKGDVEQWAAELASGLRSPIATAN